MILSPFEFHALAKENVKYIHIEVIYLQYLYGPSVVVVVVVVVEQGVNIHLKMKP